MNNKNRRTNQKGFTLIELMIVVAIIGVLSAIAVPAYQNYVTRSEASSGLATLKALVTTAELHVQEEGSFPTTAAQLGTTENANNLGTTTLAASGLVFTFGSNSSISGATVTMTRDASTGWGCELSANAGTLDGCANP
ncbi:pilin [Vibrio cyclitrophicus]|uniref:Pilus assembly protein PilA n=2 Tax=Vibrio cyclitrophicus TaxID=47951 RepID=A0A7Z1S206_9VIBR|nr:MULTISPECIES: pilin [Vibrio]KNH13081.1 pilus assembly protein PilA [Vibrio lentus]OEF41857.1 pilus assembly protein PilA [Vibrio cyclitrophicus 1F289]PMF00643.1 pilus assembly protein PilA [Vibrio cyclitrophicus]PMF19477.1 pilus assembly protein PilA [Vibrio cyclitrophicus]PMJ72780.1 pilus assembly protein PilA [Vibrio cyclitrophicus]